MGWFYTSKSDIEKKLQKLTKNYFSQMGTFKSDAEKIVKFTAGPEGGAKFTASVIETLCNVLPTVAVSTQVFERRNDYGRVVETESLVSRLPTLVTLALSVAGADANLKAKIAGKACGVLPMVVNTSPALVPDLLDVLLKAFKNDETNKDMIVVRTGDILQPVVSKDPKVAVGLIEKILNSSTDADTPDMAAQYDPYIITKSADILPALAPQNPELTEQLIKTLLFATRIPGTYKKPTGIAQVDIAAIPGNENHYKNLVIKKGLSVVDIVVNQNPEAAVNMLQNMLAAAESDKTVKPLVLKKGCDILNSIGAKDGDAASRLVQYMLAASFDDAEQIKTIVTKSCALLPVLSTNAPAETLTMVQTLLNAVGDDEIKNTIIRKSCEVLGSLSANNGPAAFSLTQTLLSSVDEKSEVRTLAVGKAADIIPGLVSNDAQSAILLIQNLMATTGGDTALTKTVVEKVRDTIPASGEKNPAAVVSILEAILPAANGDEVLKKSIIETVFSGVGRMAAREEGRGVVSGVLDVLLQNGATSTGLKKAYVENAIQVLLAIYDKKTNVGLPDKIDTVMAGDAVVVETAVDLTCKLMTEFVRKDAENAVSRIRRLETFISGNKALRAKIIDTAETVLPLVAQLASQFESAYINQYLSIAQGDNDLKEKVLSKSCDVLPDLSRKNASVAGAVINTVFKNIGIDDSLSVIFSDVAVMRNKDSHRTIVVDVAGVDGQRMVIDGLISSNNGYLQNEFIDTVKKSNEYCYDRNNAKRHYMAIFNFLNNIARNTQSAPKLKDIVKKRFNGEKAGPLPWPLPQ